MGPPEEGGAPRYSIYRSPHDEPVTLADHAAVFVSGQAAARLWDAFFKRNAASFFRDRHYLEREWPLLGRALAAADARVQAAVSTTTTSEPVTLLEAGCGAGNAVLPLLEAHLPGAVCAYACDFSPAAVELVRASAVGRAAAARGQLDLWVADVAGGGDAAAGGDDEATPISNPLVGPGRAPLGGCDFVTYIFVLSALDPERAVSALRNAAAALKPGTGRLLVRDYAAGDLAQARLASGGGAVGAAAAAAAAAGGREGGGGGAAGAAAATTPVGATTRAAACEEQGQRLAGRLYVRGDGTCAYYFEPQELADMARRAGLRVAPLEESSTAAAAQQQQHGGGGKEEAANGNTNNPNNRTRVERAPCGVEVVSRMVVNRASGAVMERRWLQAAFYRPADEGEEEERQRQRQQQQATPMVTSPQKKRARDDAGAQAVAAPSPPQQQQQQQQHQRASSAGDAAAAAAVALARLRAPYCFRPLGGGGGAGSPPAPEFRSIALPAGVSAAASPPPPPPLRWLALKSALPAGGAYASRLEGWAAEVAAALASAAAAAAGGGGARQQQQQQGASVVVVPCPGDGPSHAAAALLALHAVRVGTAEAARRASCAVLSAGGPTAGGGGGGWGDEEDGGGDDEEDGSKDESDADARRRQQQHEAALRAYRLTLAANAPRAVFERVATWRLAPAPGEGSGREDPYASGAAAAPSAVGPFDVAIALPAASPAASSALEAWRRRQQRRVLALAVGSGGGGGGGGGGVSCCCVLDFAARG